MEGSSLPAPAPLLPPALVGKWPFRALPSPLCISQLKSYIQGSVKVGAAETLRHAGHNAAATMLEWPQAS